MNVIWDKRNHRSSNESAKYFKVIVDREETKKVDKRETRHRIK